MKNIEYLGAFFRKHKLSGKIKVKFSSSTAIDDYMTDITFENGNVVNINDIIFDIDSELPDDVFDKWIEERTEGMSLSDWIQTDKLYIPKEIDTSSVDEFQKEITGLFDEVKESIHKVFELQPDEGDSESEE